MCEVTIGIPFFNPGPAFVLALRSVFAQTHNRWKLILVDDGSTDGSLAVARSIRDPRLEIVADGRSLGLPARLNQIVASSSTEFVCRMDADDVMHPARIERQLAWLRRHSSIALVGSAAWVIDNADRVIGQRRSASPRTAAESLTRVPFIHPTVFGRREWFAQHPYSGAFPRAEDLELWCRLWGSANLVSLDEPLFFYRDAPTRAIAPTLETYATTRRVIQHYGPGRVGRALTNVLVARQHVKSVVLRTGGAIGMAAMLRSRRNEPLPEDSRRHAESILAQLAAIQVPGLISAGHDV